MARNHFKLLADARTAGLSNNELDVLAYKLDMDLNAGKTDEEDTLHNSDSDIDDLQNSGNKNASKTSSQPAQQKSPQQAVPVKRKHKSTKFVQDETCEYQSACFWITCQIMMVQLLRNHLKLSPTF
jgi:hypothetical protein